MDLGNDPCDVFGVVFGARIFIREAVHVGAVEDVNDIVAGGETAVVEKVVALGCLGLFDLLRTIKLDGVDLKYGCECGAGFEVADARLLDALDSADVPP